jgi:hypothetical protein
MLIALAQQYPKLEQKSAAKAMHVPQISADG